jgi:hypothetical protein
MLVAASALSTPLAAQGMWSLGFAGTLGGSWQVEAADFGFGHSIHAGPLRSLSLAARLGAFIDEGAIIGGTRGFIGGAVLAARTGLLRIGDVGNSTNPSAFGVDVTVEAVGYGAVHSPLPLGSAWGAVSVLPGLRLGEGSGVHVSLLVGPTFFFGKSAEVRPFLGLRFELPMASRRAHR